MADMGGGNAVSGAVGAGINEAVQKELKKIENPELHQIASGIIGGAAAEIVGGDGQTGASTAISGTKNNWLNHRQQVELVEELNNAQSNEEKLQILAKYAQLSEVNNQTGTDPDNGEQVEQDPNTGKGYESIESDVMDALGSIKGLDIGGIKFEVDGNQGLHNNLLAAEAFLTMGKNITGVAGSITTNLVDAELGRNVIDQLRTSYTIGQIRAPQMGPAATLEIPVDTTGKSTILLKNVCKVAGGVIALGQTTYSVYQDYEKSGGFNEKFVLTAGIDVGEMVVVSVVSGAAVAAGAPVLLVATAGGVGVYLINESVVNPKKESILNE